MAMWREGGREREREGRLESKRGKSLERVRWGQAAPLMVVCCYLYCNWEESFLKVRSLGQRLCDC